MYDMHIQRKKNTVFRKVYYGTSKGNKYEMGGKYIFQCFLSQYIFGIIILYINCGHQGAVINMAHHEKWKLVLPNH